MRDNVYKFRRLKWREPKKLKVLVEDISPRQHPLVFGAVVVVVFCLAFGLAYLVS